MQQVRGWEQGKQIEWIRFVCDKALHDSIDIYILVYIFEPGAIK